MRKLFTLLMALMFSVATLTQAKTFPLQAKPVPAQHMTKKGLPDKRYNENKNLKNDGTPDMRFKTSKKAAAKAAGGDKVGNGKTAKGGAHTGSGKKK